MKTLVTHNVQNCLTENASVINKLIILGLVVFCQIQAIFYRLAGKMKENKPKKNVNSVISCSTQGNPSASSQHPAHVAGAIECLPTLFPLPAVEPALQNRQRVFR